MRPAKPLTPVFISNDEANAREVAENFFWNFCNDCLSLS